MRWASLVGLVVAMPMTLAFSSLFGHGSVASDVDSADLTCDCTLLMTRLGVRCQCHVCNDGSLTCPDPTAPPANNECNAQIHWCSHYSPRCQNCYSVVDDADVCYCRTGKTGSGTPCTCSSCGSDADCGSCMTCRPPVDTCGVAVGTPSSGCYWHDTLSASCDTCCPRLRYDLPPQCECPQGIACRPKCEQYSAEYCLNRPPSPPPSPPCSAKGEACNEHTHCCPSADYYYCGVHGTCQLML